MRVFPLGSLCDITVGRTPARADADYWGGNHAWLSIADMKQGAVIRYTKERITDQAALAGRLIAPGTVLLSFKLSIGKVARAGIPLYTNEAIAALPIKDTNRLDAAYLAWALKSSDLTANTNRAAMGATLNKAALQLIPMPVPPLEEQRRIAEILDAAEAIRTKRRQVLAHLDTLNQSIFNDMFSSVLWDSTLGEMARVQTGPFGSLLHKSDYVQGGVPLLNPMHIQNGSLIPDAEYSVSELKASSLQAFRLQRGDVVLARRGEMGRAGVASDAHKGMLCGTGSLILRPRQGVDSRYLHAVVTSPRMKGHLNRESLGATLPNLNSKIVMGSPAPRVPLQTGRDFAAKIGAVDALSTTVARALDADNELFASLQSRAFLGAL